MGALVKVLALFAVIGFVLCKPTSPPEGNLCVDDDFERCPQFIKITRPPNCEGMRVDFDKTKPFPACCAQIHCDNYPQESTMPTTPI